jgi:energy-coupling factor transporter ATP-binding protein EcfA2
MDINIKNFRGIKEAHLTASKIILLSGNNASGKTSIIQAVASLLTGKTIPIEGLTKKQAGKLIYSGQKDSEISMETANGKSTICYPSAEMSSDGVCEGSSAMACGIDSILSYKTKERAPIIIDQLNAKPTKPQLLEALQKNNITGNVERLWATIVAQGWDAAHEAASTTRTKLKGSWETLTGANYGSNIAEGWQPDCWTDDLATTTEEILTGLYHQEIEWYNLAISETAINENEMTRLQQLVDSGIGVKEKIETIKNEIKKLISDRDELQVQLNKLQNPNQQTFLECPHCKGKLKISGDTIVIGVPLTDIEIGHIKTIGDELRQTVMAITADLNNKNTTLINLFSCYTNATNASKKLAETTRKKPIENSHGTIEDCKARVEHAKKRLEAFTKKRDVDSVISKIADNEKLVVLLSPTGLRLEVLLSKLHEFNDLLKKVSRLAGWGIVEINSDMAINYGSTPYMLLSKSEQFRVAVTLQIVFAELDKSAWILVDGADILDASGRNGLFKVLLSTGKESIVGMTTSKKSDVPPIDKIGVASYWIENNTATRI